VRDASDGDRDLEVARRRVGHGRGPRQVALAQGALLAADLAELAREGVARRRPPRAQHESGGAAPEPVDRHRRLAREALAQDRGERVPDEAAARDRRQAGGLVDHDHVVVREDDAHVARHVGLAPRRTVPAQDVARAEAVVRPGGETVAEDQPCLGARAPVGLGRMPVARRVEARDRLAVGVRPDPVGVGAAFVHRAGFGKGGYGARLRMTVSASGPRVRRQLAWKAGKSAASNSARSRRRRVRTQRSPAGPSSETSRA